MTPHTTSSTASQPPKRSLLSASLLIAGLVLVAKFLGFARDWVMVQVYGLSVASDAYLAAFQLPQFALILLGGLGGPFHTATVAVLGKLLQQPNHHAHVRRLSALFVTLTGGVFAVASVAVYLYALPIMSTILGLPVVAGEPLPPLLAAASQQLKVMSPILLIGGVVGIFYGALNVVHVYAWPTLSPTVMNLVMIVALLAFPTDSTGLLLAWSSLVGAACQLLAQWPQYTQKGFGTLAFKLHDEDKPLLKEWLTLLLPAMLGSTMGQVMSYVDLFFAARLPEGTWSAVTLANRVMQLPIGVLQTALLIPLFPRLVELVTQRDDEALRSVLVKGMGGVWLLSLPLIWVFLCLGEPIIRLVFGYGRFEAGDVALVTVALVFQLGQLLPYFVRDTLTRVFYAFGDSLTPLWVGILAIGLKFGLNWLFIDYLKAFAVEGITLSITLVTLFNMGLLGWLLRYRYQLDLPWLTWIKLLGRLGVASLAVALPCYAAKHFHWLTVETPRLQAVGILALLALISVVGYTLMLKWVGLFEYITPVVEKVRHKLFKGRSPSP